MTQMEGEEIITSMVKQVCSDEFGIDIGEHAFNTQSGRITREDAKQFSYNDFIHEIAFFNKDKLNIYRDFKPSFLENQDLEKLRSDIRTTIFSIADECLKREYISKEERERFASDAYWRRRLKSDQNIRHGVEVMQAGSTLNFSIKEFEDFAKKNEFEIAHAVLMYPVPNTWGRQVLELRKPFGENELTEKHIWNTLVSRSLPSLYESWKGKLNIDKTQ